MSTSARLTEKWINRGLWLISVIFGVFLIGLGNLVVRDLPKVQDNPLRESYIDQSAYSSISASIQQKQSLINELNSQIQKENQTLYKLQEKYEQSKDSYNNWIAARSSTQDQAQNTEVLNRTRDLEKQQSNINEQKKNIDNKNIEFNLLQNEMTKLTHERDEIERAADEILNQVTRQNEVKVFIYRLLITLPLLAVGTWLFLRKRKSEKWPFVWGFIYFSLFTFFVELVPYLPSYGGYVRYIVGIIMTFAVGHYTIKMLQSYLERQRKAESMPNTELKEKLNYDLVHQRLSRSICPGCERSIDLKDEHRNFCIHCGTGIFNHCTQCNARKNAFAKYCHSCGAPSSV